MPGRLPRLTRRAEFLRAAGKGRKAARPGVLLQALPETGGPLRLGFTATKRLGGRVDPVRCGCSRTGHVRRATPQRQSATTKTATLSITIRPTFGCSAAHATSHSTILSRLAGAGNPSGRLR